MKSQKKGFTIAELIVVIIILSILATLGFVSFSGYSSGVRDANRVAQITGISSSLGVYNIKNFLPLPDNHILIEVNGEDIAYQGFAGQELLEEIDYKKGGKDPKDEQYYTYYITKARKDFQLLAFLSEPKEFTKLDMLDNVYSAADYSTRAPYVEGKRLGVLVEPDTNIPIQEIDAIQATKKLDVGTTTDLYEAILKNGDTVVGDNTILIDLKESALAGGKGCSGVTGKIVCSSGGKILAGDDLIGRKWGDGTIGQFCDDYKNPTGGYSYAGDVGNGVYWIDPTGSSPYKVYCDMNSEGGGWSYSVMLGDPTTQNLFVSGNTTKITSITSGTTVGSIADIWVDSADKDIMIVCEIDDPDLSNYEIPFIIYDYKKSDIGELTKANKDNSTFSSTALLASWNGNNYTLSTSYGNHSGNTAFDLRDDSNKSVFLLHDSEEVETKDDLGWINANSPAYKAGGNGDATFSSTAYCMVAIR